MESELCCSADHCKIRILAGFQKLMVADDEMLAEFSGGFRNRLRGRRNSRDAAFARGSERGKHLACGLEIIRNDDRRTKRMRVISEMK